VFNPFNLSDLVKKGNELTLLIGKPHQDGDQGLEERSPDHIQEIVYAVTRTGLDRHCPGEMFECHPGGPRIDQAVDLV